MIEVLGLSETSSDGGEVGESNLECQAFPGEIFLFDSQDELINDVRERLIDISPSNIVSKRSLAPNGLAFSVGLHFAIVKASHETVVG